MRDFYYEYYEKIGLSNPKPIFNQVTTSYNETTGYITGSNTDGTSTRIVLPLGGYAGANPLRYIEPGALVKFVPPTGKYFTPTGKLVSTPSVTTTQIVWAKVVSVVSDGTANKLGKLTTGIGPLMLNVIVPNGALVSQVVPKFLGYIPTDIQSLMIDLIFNYKNFGLTYDYENRSWSVVQERNLNLLGNWDYNTHLDISGQKANKMFLYLAISFSKVIS